MKSHQIPTNSPPSFPSFPSRPQDADGGREGVEGVQVHGGGSRGAHRLEMELQIRGTSLETPENVGKQRFWEW